MSDVWHASMLKTYDISETTGFLPSKTLTELPEYFRSWSDLAKNLSTHLENHEVRKLVDEMPLLADYLDQMSEDEDEKTQQLRLAHVFLTFIGSGYIWQEGENDIKKVIPKQLAIPWHGISQILGLKPVPCMSSVALNNYKPRDPNKPLCLENLDVICEVPGARWFFLVTIQVELDAVKGIKAIINAKKAVAEGNNAALKKALGEIIESLGDIKKTSERMREQLTGDVFYNKVRPFLGGYGPDSKIPEGLIFEEISKEPLTAIGGSAAQSSTIQSFDAALGVEHPANKQGYLSQVRDYMPPKHSQFIEDIATKKPLIKDYVCKSGDEELKEVYRKAVKALVSFRDMHLGLVSHYILKPAAEAKGSSANEDEERGTGGTELKDFLKGLRDSTRQAAEQ